MRFRIFIALLLLPSLAFSGQGMGPGPGVGKTYVGGGETLIAHIEGDEANGASMLVGTGTITSTAITAAFTEAVSGRGFVLIGPDRVSVSSANINPNKFRVEFKFKDYTGSPAAYGKFFVVDADTTLQFARNAADTAYNLTYNSVVVWSETAGTNLWDGTARTISVELDNATDSAIVKIDGATITNDAGAVTWPTDIGATTTLLFGNRVDEARYIGGLMGDIKVYALP